MPRKKPAAKKPAAESVPVDAIKHDKETRPNIPTRELQAYAVEHETKPTTVRYPRDPSLDPQLVWKGKDEQDAADLEVPAVPVYIQETIYPQAIIADIQARAAAGRPRPADLFSDVNGADEDTKTEFYQHPQKWKNRMILGDSLLVMTSLAEKEHLKGRVQMIYFDPPYGIKFGSNWQVSTRKREVKDAKREELSGEREVIKAFRDTWELGIHSYLPNVRDRLVAARELLTESGSIFVQIGDENVHLVRCVMDEVFGRENFVAMISFRKTASQAADKLAGAMDYLLLYAKSLSEMKYRPIYKMKQVGGEGGAEYQYVEEENGSVRRLTDEEVDSPGRLSSGARVFATTPMVSQRPPGSFDVEFKGGKYRPGTGFWKTGEPGMAKLAAANRLIPSGKSLKYIRYFDDFPAMSIANYWDDTASGASKSNPKIYVVQTSTKVIERCLLMTTDPGDLVLDPTCGGGTTAYVAEQWGRRWITTDTSRVAVTLARTRLMAAKFPYYLLADSIDGRKKEAALAGTAPPGPLANFGNDIRQGFVYRRVPHVTLKSIANNPDIDPIRDEFAPIFTKLLADLNKHLGTAWQEWDVPALPADPGSTRAKDVLEEWAKKSKTALKPWSEKARGLLEKWWAEKKRQRGKIDAAIARHADTETLYDQPFEDKGVVRVTGPFTVESLSPHRVLPAAEPIVSAAPAETAARTSSGTASDFVGSILDNLKKAGVQNTRKGQKLTFDTLETYPNEYLQARGTYTESGEPKRVAVCVGPEFGTVGPELLRYAGREANKGIGFDMLLVCGFAFDPHVYEDGKEVEKQLGRVKVWFVRMNPDLAMGEELKKTGAGNLFMVFGEPDLDVATQSDGKLVVTINGVDVFDPTTGQQRSGGTDDIACWFIDTAYDGDSFFVRHAYFLGADEPYEKLQRALKAEVDEGEWAKLYSAESVPFDPPKSGKIAVKVINHYGDEVLKVYPVAAKAPTLSKPSK